MCYKIIIGGLRKAVKVYFKKKREKTVHFVKNIYNFYLLCRGGVVVYILYLGVWHHNILW